MAFCHNTSSFSFERDFTFTLNNDNGLKSIFLKKILAKSNSLVNLHDSAPHFGACLPEISGQNRANLLGCCVWQVLS